MRIQLTNPELQRFITEQVDAGHFPSPQAAIEAAVEQMMLERSEAALTDEDVLAINAAEDEIDRGDCIDFATFAEDMRKKYRARC